MVGKGGGLLSWNFYRVIKARGFAALPQPRPYIPKKANSELPQIRLFYVITSVYSTEIM